MYSLLVLFAIAGALFAGCSSDDGKGNSGDDRIETNKKLLIGTWVCVTREIEESEGQESMLTLKADGKYEEVDLETGTTSTGSYYVSEDKIVFREPQGNDSFVDEYLIKQLTSKEFVLQLQLSGGAYGSIVTGKKH